MRETKDDEHRQKRPAKCREIDKPERQPEKHGQQRAHCRAAGNAQYIGVGQWVA
jgi:hypothetical protein